MIEKKIIQGVDRKRGEDELARGQVGMVEEIGKVDDVEWKVPHII